MRDHIGDAKRLVSIKAVCALTSLGKSSVYVKVSSGDFPKPRQLGKGRVAWLIGDIDAWIDSRPEVGRDVAKSAI